MHSSFYLLQLPAITECLTWPNYYSVVFAFSIRYMTFLTNSREENFEPPGNLER